MAAGVRGVQNSWKSRLLYFFPGGRLRVRGTGGGRLLVVDDGCNAEIFWGNWWAAFRFNDRTLSGALLPTTSFGTSSAVSLSACTGLRGFLGFLSGPRTG